MARRRKEDRQVQQIDRICYKGECDLEDLPRKPRRLGPLGAEDPLMRHVARGLQR